MNPFAMVGDALVTLLRRLVLLALVGAALAYAFVHFAGGEPSGPDALVKANPGWTEIEGRDGWPTRFDDGSGRGELLLSRDDLGPYRIERVDCETVRAAWPAWFAMPDVALGTCVKLHDREPPTLVLDVHTPLRITQLWERHFEPLAEKEQVLSGGARSGRFPSAAETDVPPGKQPPEESGSAFYTLDPKPGSDDRTVRISMWRHAGATDMAITFRKEPPP